MNEEAAAPVTPEVQATTRTVDPRDVLLDPQNPRLTDAETERAVDAGREGGQVELRRIMIRRFNVDELAESILVSGYLEFDPIICWENEDERLYVREGNRRIATLQMVLEPRMAPERYQDSWEEYNERLGEDLEEDISNIRVQVFDDRNDTNVTAYVGFRHVTGVKQWPSHEKAGFIAELIEEQEWDYEAIADRLGSYPKHVERHYLAYQLVRQARRLDIPGAEEMSESFGNLLRALQATDIQEFLGIDYTGDPEDAEEPVPDDRLEDFEDFVRWTFGTEDKKRLLPDSRRITDWGKILQDEDVVEWLRETPNPDFGRAWYKCGGQLESLEDTLSKAAARLEESVAHVRRYQEEEDIKDAVEECAYYMYQILRDFEEVGEEQGLRVIEDDD